MSIKSFILLGVAVCMLLTQFSCRNPEPHGHAHSEHGASETPAFDTTIWVEDYELFVEFPYLVVNQVSRFAAHFTHMDNHQPVRHGRVTVSLVSGKKGIRNTAEHVSSPGIFIPSIQPKATGRYDLWLVLSDSTGNHKFVIPQIQVYANTEDARNGFQENETNGISFLKEQAWKINFQTRPVTVHDVFEVINTSGVWKTAASSQQTIVATTSGVVRYAENSLTEGVTLHSGETLASIQSNSMTTDNQQARIEQTKADWEKAKVSYERKLQLFESGVIPSSDFEEAKRLYITAQSSYETVSHGYSANGKTVHAPFQGILLFRLVNNGQHVNEGDALFTVAKGSNNLLEVNVDQSYAGQIAQIENVWYQKKIGHWGNLKDNNGRIVSTSPSVDSRSGALTVYVETNDAVEIPEGGFSEVQIATGPVRTNPTVPNSALIEEYGDYYVIVQLGGELFEKRQVHVGHKNGEHTEITQGLKGGEMLVTQGAYQVKMASMSGQAPAHGHAH